MAVVRKGSRKGKTRVAGRAASARLVAPAKADNAATQARRPRLAAVVAKGLPGWELAETPVQTVAAAEDALMNTDQEPSIAYLKRKFLGEDVSDSAEEDLFDAEDSRKAVRVRPKRGGKAKTADVTPDGKVTIVQG